MKTYLLLALCLTLSSCIREEPVEEELRIAVGDGMPWFEVTTLDGRDFSPVILEGRESVIVFFNTDCPDCRRELPLLQAQADASSEVQYLCIAREEEAESITQFWEENNLRMPVAAQSDRRIYEKFAIIGIPRAFRFDKNLILQKIY